METAHSSTKKCMTRHTYVILACIADGESWSGYDIAKYLTKQLTHVFPIPAKSQIYGELTLLEQIGYSTSEYIVQERRPNKYVHRITQEGSNVLAHWIDETMELQNSTVPFLIPLVLKIIDMQEMPERFLQYANQAAQYIKMLSVFPENLERGLWIARHHAMAMAQAEYDWAIAMAQL